MNDNHILSWPDVHQFLNHVIREVKACDYNISYITCPPGRGGLVPAAILAYKLDVPFVAWESATTSGGLCIDDIIDTGATFKKCMDIKPGLQYAAMTARWTHPGVPVGKVLHTPEYVIFPWDVK